MGGNILREEAVGEPVSWGVPMAGCSLEVLPFCEPRKEVAWADRTRLEQKVYCLSQLMPVFANASPHELAG